MSQESVLALISPKKIKTQNWDVVVNHLLPIFNVKFSDS